MGRQFIENYQDFFVSIIYYNNTLIPCDSYYTHFTDKETDTTGDKVPQITLMVSGRTEIQTFNSLNLQEVLK